MSLLAINLQPYFAKGIYNVSGRVDRLTFGDLIANSKSAYQVSFDDARLAVELDFRTDEAILGFLASDCSRLSSAAFQTASNIDTELAGREQIPWGVVKIYYAAFYAAHAVSRFLGHSCSALENRHLQKINAVGTVGGASPGFRLEGGTWHCAFSADMTKVNLTRIPINNSHEAFWTFFEKRWNDIFENLLSNPLSDAKSLSVRGQIESFDRLMKKRGSYTWLSTVRNDIQYKHKHQIWFPSSNSKQYRSALGRISSQWYGDPMSIDLSSPRYGLIGEFVSACAFLISVCRVLTMRAIELAKVSSRSFLQYGPATFLKMGSGSV